MLYLLFASLQAADRVAPTPAPHGSGAEWMVIASILIPMLLLYLIVYVGSKRAVP